METFRSRPKGEFIKEANWEELYVLTRYWKKDLEFYKEDLQFLYRLIDKYLIWITREENTTAVNQMVRDLQKVKSHCFDLLEKVKVHLNQLGSLVEDPQKGNTRIFRMEHEHLEDEIADFVKAFRKNRTRVFSVTEHIVESEKLEDLLRK